MCSSANNHCILLSIATLLQHIMLESELLQIFAIQYEVAMTTYYCCSWYEFRHQIANRWWGNRKLRVPAWRDKPLLYLLQENYDLLSHYTRWFAQFMKCIHLVSWDLQNFAIWMKLIYILGLWVCDSFLMNFHFKTPIFKTVCLHCEYNATSMYCFFNNKFLN